MDWETSVMVEVSRASVCAPRETVWSSRVGMCGWGGLQGFLILGVYARLFLYYLPSVCLVSVLGQVVVWGSVRQEACSFPSGSVCKQKLLLSGTADIF